MKITVNIHPNTKSKIIVRNYGMDAKVKIKLNRKRIKIRVTRWQLKEILKNKILGGDSVFITLKHITINRDEYNLREKTLILKSSRKCCHCNSKKFIVMPVFGMVHGARADCVKCKRFYKWVAKKDYDTMVQKAKTQLFSV